MSTAMHVSWHPFRSVLRKKNVCQKKHFLRKCQQFSVLCCVLIQFKIQIGWLCHYPSVLVFFIIIVIPPFHLRLSFFHIQVLSFLCGSERQRKKNQKKIIMNLFLLISSSQILLVPEKWNYSERQQLKEKFIHASNSYFSI